MPYLVFRGAKMWITKPNGRTVRHTCKADTVFQDGETIQKGQPFHFQKDGFKLVVDTADVKPIVFTCMNCSGVVEEEGLCEECRRLVLRKFPNG